MNFHFSERNTFLFMLNMKVKLRGLANYLIDTKLNHLIGIYVLQVCGNVA